MRKLQNNMKRILTLFHRYHLGWLILATAFIGVLTVSAFQEISHYSQNQLPSGFVELKLNKTKYQLGEQISFRVINHFPTPIYVLNQCPSEPLHVFKWNGESWIQLHDKTQDADSECYQEPRNIAIASEGQREYNFDEWPNLFTQPGVYRIAMNIDHYDDIPFQDFVILEPQKIIKVENPAPAINTQPTQEPIDSTIQAAPEPAQTYFEQANIRFEEFEEEDDD